MTPTPAQPPLSSQRRREEGLPGRKVERLPVRGRQETVCVVCALTVRLYDCLSYCSLLLPAVRLLCAAVYRYSAHCPMPQCAGRLCVRLTA